MNFAKFKSAGCIIGPIWVSSIEFHLIFGILFVKKILDNDPSLVATLQLTLSDDHHISNISHLYHVHSNILICWYAL